jgi:hypothetical protein
MNRSYSSRRRCCCCALVTSIMTGEEQQLLLLLGTHRATGDNNRGLLQAASKAADRLNSSGNQQRSNSSSYVKADQRQIPGPLHAVLLRHSGNSRENSVSQIECRSGRTIAFIGRRRRVPGQKLRTGGGPGGRPHPDRLRSTALTE